MCLRMMAPFLVSASGVPRTTFGLLNHELVQQLGHGLVDKLAAVIGMKTVNDEGKLGQHGGQHRLQIGLRDALHRCRNPHCVTSSTALM
jgi:hypothetical protein